MGKFRKEGKKEVPQVSTSSLPDIVYMLIFFFMITTTMRELTPSVEYKLPKASQVQKLEKKALVSNIYIGIPKNTEKEGNQSRIQLNDYPLEFDHTSNRQLFSEKMAEWIQKERDSRNEEDRKLLTTALKVDENTRMEFVTDVKQELRKLSAFRINYTALKETSRN